MWVTENDEQFLEIWVLRAKPLQSFSSSVRIFIRFPVAGTDTPVLFAFWQNQPGAITMDARTSDGSVLDEGVLNQAGGSGLEVHFRFPGGLIRDPERLFVESFDLPVEGELQGYDTLFIESFPHSVGGEETEWSRDSFREVASASFPAWTA